MLRILSGEELRRAVSMREAIAAVGEAFVALWEGRVHAPPRIHLSTPSGVALYMPGFAEGIGLGVKAVAVYPENPRLGLPTLHAAVLLQDGSTGRPLALLEGSTLTALRTGAATGVATDLLARPQPSVVGLIGAGVQARTQLEAVCAVREVTQVRVYARTPEHREAFVAWARAQPWIRGASVFPAPSAELAVRGADIVITATTSATPVLRAEDVAWGSHLNAIGAFTPAAREIPPELVARSRVFVESLEAARAEAGDLILAAEETKLDWSTVTELGAVAAGARPGRTTPDEVTLFKSVGHAVQDLAVGMLALRRAEERGLGTLLSW
ncbi:MAG: ornithine cyclodeaminase family protein [Armatimonadota bacterium]|nr:ornithine cyclodeaminase family protein [Armatimonadota bacterium]MDR7440310.1 ornithine cyclodeaminase family protein [Armatimonadota bacterium]MDR7562771.1 ornithine cyclodeaminase family protein [Armatimonadota bacterium]MDR7568119.1 ornithine cyclodeaminase family protein [Armatimonadota bacterium]MDR7600916.1 ornithine cyclodeaminase family protein [Armatimonadota bacterium]